MASAFDDLIPDQPKTASAFDDVLPDVQPKSAFDDILPSPNAKVGKSAFDDLLPDVKQPYAPTPNVETVPTSHALSRAPIGIGESLRLRAQAQSGAPETTTSAVARGLGFGLAPAVDALQEQKLQELATGETRSVFGGTQKYADMAKEGGLFDIGLKKDIALAGLQMPFVQGAVSDWDKTEGARIADPTARRQARLGYVQTLATEALKDRLRNKMEAGEQLSERDRTLWAKIGGGAVENLGYTAAFMAGAPAAISTSAARRFGELTSDKLALTPQGDIAVQAKGDETGTALIKAGAGGAAEYGVEKIGGAALERGLGAVVRRIGGAELLNAVKRVPVIGNAVRTFTNLGKVTGVQGLPGEVFEEVAQDVIDIGTGVGLRGAEKTDTDVIQRTAQALRDFDTQDVVLSMLLMQVAQGGVAATKAFNQYVEKGNRLDGLITAFGGDPTGMTMSEKRKVFNAIKTNIPPEKAQAIISKLGARAQAAYQQVTDKTEQGFRADTPEGVLNAKAQYAQDVAQRVAGKVPVEAFDTEADLVAAYPEIAQTPTYKPGDVPAVYHQGKMLVVLDQNDKPADIVSSVLHELGGHAAIDAMPQSSVKAMMAQLGGTAYRDALAQKQAMRGEAEAQTTERLRELEALRTTDPQAYEAGVADVTAGLDAAYKRTDTLAPEEALAYMRENSGANPTAYQRAIASVRKHLRKAMPNMRFSDAEVEVFFRDAAKAVRGEGGAFTRMPSVPVAETPVAVEQAEQAQAFDEATKQAAAPSVTKAPETTVENAQPVSQEVPIIRDTANVPAPVQAAPEAAPVAVEVPERAPTTPQPTQVDGNRGVTETTAPAIQSTSDTVQSAPVAPQVDTSRPVAEQGAPTEPAVRDATFEESAIVSRLEPMNDINREPTGWNYRDFSDGRVLVSYDGKKAVSFPVKDVRSGSELQRVKADAQAYAMDNPYTGAAPEGELVTRPLYGNGEETPALAAPTVTAPSATVAPAATAQQPEVGLQREVDLSNPAEAQKIADGLDRAWYESLAKEYGTPVAPVRGAEEPYGTLSRASDMLRRAARKSRNPAQLQRVLDESRGMIEESQIADEIANNRYASDATFEQALANEPRRAMAGSDKEQYLRERRKELQSQPITTPTPVIAAPSRKRKFGERKQSPKAEREVITPSDDTVIGKNAYGEQLYQRADGSVYRMRFDRPTTRPNGYPDFGGNLSPVSVPAWQQTQEEYVANGGTAKAHKSEVGRAWKRGDAVSKDVVSAYPDLMDKFFKPQTKEASDATKAVGEQGGVQSERARNGEERQAREAGGRGGVPGAAQGEGQVNGVRPEDVQVRNTADAGGGGSGTSKPALDVTSGRAGMVSQTESVRDVDNATRGQVAGSERVNADLAAVAEREKRIATAAKQRDVRKAERGAARFRRNVSPAQDAEYAAAVERGDVAAAQRMVDEAARAAGYTVGPVWHGTASEFNAFEPSLAGSVSGGSDVGLFLTDNPDEAEFYAREAAGLSDSDDENGRVLRVFVHATNPSELTDAETRTDHAKAIAKKFAQGHDAVWMQDKNARNLAVFDPAQIKSADPITRDDSGRVIPLSARFNDATPDIRFRRNANPQTETTEFRKWFADSKVVDADGEPMVVYHGTNRDISEFKPSAAGDKTGNPNAPLGYFFSPDATEASRYARDWGTAGGNVMPVYLAINNPYRMPYAEFDKLAMASWNLQKQDSEYDANSVVRFGDAEGQRRASEKRAKYDAMAREQTLKRRDELIRDGYDGIVTRVGGKEEYIAFSPTQIKSATGNVGTFDATNPDIRFRNRERQRAVEDAGLASLSDRYVQVPKAQDAASRKAQLIRNAVYADGLDREGRDMLRNQAEAELSKGKAKMALDAAEGAFDTSRSIDTARMVTAMNATMLDAVKPGATDETIDLADEVNYQGQKKFTNLGRSLAFLRDKYNTPEGRRAELAKLAMTPDDVTNAKLAQATTWQERKAIRRESIAKAKKRLAELRKVTIVDENGRKIPLDIESITSDQLMNDKLFKQFVSKIAQKRATMGEKFYEFWQSSILSSPVTLLVVNPVGNAANIALEIGPQRQAEIIIGKVLRSKDAPTEASTAAGFKYANAAMPDAWKNAKKTFTTEQAQLGEYADKWDTSGQAIGKTLFGVNMGFDFGKAVRSPRNFLSATDQGFRTWLMNFHVADLATRKFDQLLKDPTSELTESDRDDYIKAAMKDDTDFYQQAQKITDRQLFQTKPGIIGQLFLGSRRSENPIARWLSKYLIPFVTTPANVIKTGARKSPLGTIPLVWNYASGKYSGSESAKAEGVRLAAEQAVGWAVMGAIGLLMQGDDDDPLGRPSITGTQQATGRFRPGEREYEKRNEPAMSVRIGDSWYSYRRIEPIATILSTVVDIMEAAQHVKNGDLSKAGERMAKNLVGMFSDRTYIKTVGDIIDAVRDNDPGSYMQIATGTLGGFVPNIAKTTMRGFDPVVRDIRNRSPKGTLAYYETALKRFGQSAIPAASLQPIARYDVAGRPITKEGEGGAGVVERIFSPFQRQSATRLTKVDAMLKRYAERTGESNVLPAPPQVPDISLFGRKDKIPLTDDEFAEYQRIAGETAARRLSSMSFNFDNPTERDVERVKKVYSDARAFAKQRITAQVRQRVAGERKA